MSGSEPTLAQQIVRYLRNEVLHGFRLCMSDGNTVILKGVLLLIAIAHLYEIQIIIFSTRKKPVEIAPPTNGIRYTVALLRHQDSILSVGEWYPLGLAQNWIKQTATVRMTSTIPMASPAAVKRPPGAAPKKKVPANYASISNDTLKGLLQLVMKERLQNDYEKEVRKNFTQQKLDKFKEKNLNRARPPKGYVESVLERLGEAIDTSNMNGIGLSSRLQRIKDPNTVQIWKEVVKEYLTAISTTNTSNIGTSAATPSQSSGSRTASTE